MTRSPASIRSRRPSSAQLLSRNSGFTLTEVLLVLAILGVIAAMVVPNLLGRQKEALIRSTKMSIKSMEDASKQYAIAHDGEFPTGDSASVIGMLLNPGQDRDGNAISPYLEKTPKDAWDQPLFYEYANGAIKPKIWSSGPNKQNEEGAGDDVSNQSDAG